MDAPEGAGGNAYFAPQAKGFIDHHRPGFRFPVNGSCRANFQTGGGFALKAGQREYGSVIQVEMNPDIGIFPFESPRFLEGTDPLAIPAGKTAVLFHVYDFQNRLLLNYPSTKGMVFVILF
jgi:hypothetical protein